MVFFKKKEESEEEKDTDIDNPEVEKLAEAVRAAGLPEHALKVAAKEIERLKKTSPASAEYTIGSNYIDYLLALPWEKRTEDNLDIKRAEYILNQDHYGLDEIKHRILEYLAVRILMLSRTNRILVVDDEEVTRTNLEYVLSKDGYDVVTAASGKQALKILEAGGFDLVITDLKMDTVNGIGVLEAAKAKDSGTEVIIITGYATVDSAVEAIKKGSFQYISKPFKLDDIRSTVQTALSRKNRKLESRGPVLCFAGPPGTGKTSLGMSIAKSLEKKFIRISLAGMKDEAELRGHRRSYVGAMPGRIIQEIRRAESSNPVFMLDELDKIGQDFKGDPASALLEILDPEQNARFSDHYLDVPFDLSGVMFIATANTTDRIPGPLLDRLEVIRLSGYTEKEKEKIAFDYLIPRAIEDASLAAFPPRFTPEAVHIIIHEYTREAGLRNLQRQLTSICRKLALAILTKKEGEKMSLLVGPGLVRKYLGPPKYFHEVADGSDKIGIASALAWTETGGELIFVEATKMKGRSNLILTGSLGDVMKESAQAALSYIRSNTGALNIEEDFFDDIDIHIHVPAGAIPKDGPSAGLTIAVALISLLTKRPARREVGLTGELTLSGRILPVGGIREKILAAQRSGLTTVVFPEKNNPDLVIIPPELKENIKIITADRIDAVIDQVLD